MHLFVRKSSERPQLQVAPLSRVVGPCANRARAQISFKLGVNKFSDLDDKEMGAFMGFSGVRSSLKQGKNLKGVHKPGTVKQLAPSLNWVEKGAVGPVRDQGSCGSCWAHAAGAEIESHLAINEGFLTDRKSSVFFGVCEKRRTFLRN